MAPKKLSESDKQDILNRYRQSDETAASLASQYGVSTSTVSRLLKQSIPEREYEALVQQKRSAGRTSETEDLSDDLPDIDAISAALAVVMKADHAAGGTIAQLPLEELDELEALEESQEGTASGNRRRRKRSRSPLSESVPVTAPVTPPVVEKQLEVLSLGDVTLDAATAEPESSIPEPVKIDKPSRIQPPILVSRDTVVEPIEAEQMEEDDLDDLDDEDDLDDLDDDLDGDDDDDEDDLDDDLNGDGAIEMVHVQGKGMVNVLPLSEAQIPRTCYVVVDRSAELITRPLKDFADLGQIPPEEVQAKTLPVFDNHRVAKRFLRRMQRIVKVPDGRMFQKVTPYLQAKGITRLLIDGQIYSI
ncbi:hypothetical protein [Leptolyngbya ohadii]|uniref:hypothetical protein n=1 Tax=Leptolyngbya ohadii TaxID=1962290 RepID=UPI000B5A09AC|nr:hypothetical protein [Leptolyngbya ohadii]